MNATCTTVGTCNYLRRLLVLACVLAAIGLVVPASAAEDTNTLDEDTRLALQKNIPDIAQVIVTTKGSDNTEAKILYHDFTSPDGKSTKHEGAEINLPYGVKPRDGGALYLFAETGSFCHCRCTLESGSYNCNCRMFPGGNSC